MLLDILYWGGTVLGITGAVFISFRNPKPSQIIWLFSNTMLITANAINYNLPMIILFSIYFIITSIGVYNYYIRKETVK